MAVRRAEFVSRGTLLLIAVLAAPGCGTAARHTARGSTTLRSARLITALPGNSFEVGSYSIRHVSRFEPGTRSSLTDVEFALGRSSHCVGEGNQATVRWASIGLSGEFETLGGFSDSAGHLITDQSTTGCQHRDEIQVSSLTATGPGWHTVQGLGVSDFLERLLRLYPRAVHDGSNWWLHTVKSPYGLGDEVPDMTARVVNGRVQSVTVLIGAQGE
jgi:hypothetical protein